MLPPGGNPTPKFVKCMISQPFMNRFIPNFQALLSELGQERWPEEVLKYVTPWGWPLPHILKIRDISPIYKPIATKFSGIGLLNRYRIMTEKLKYVTPWG